jgi:Xaa-Pro aminopeptidase
MTAFAAPSLVARRERLAAALRPALDGAVLLVHAGAPVPLPENTDQTYPFLSHAEYRYVAGGECRGGVIAHDPAEAGPGAWRSFAPAVTEAERFWEGRIQAEGEPLDTLPAWLAQRAGRPVVILGSPPVPPSDPARLSAVREAFRHARRPKDDAELALLRHAAACTAAGYATLPGLLRPGISERAVRVELEAAFLRAGADGTGYGTIVGGGPNAAILHAEPGTRLFREGEFVLVDAGAVCERYVCDVTRTYVVGRPASGFHRDLHQLVLDVEQAAIRECLPGAEWRDLHLRAAQRILEGLTTLGLVSGNSGDLLEREVHTLFFPHGLGHLVGLGVRDASGTLPGRRPDPRPSLRSLRLDLPLAPGYVVTVEPGIYFIPTLLDDPGRRARFADCVAWERVDRLRDVGGVRIEDNVLVTAGAPEVLTDAIPRGL